MRRCRESEGKSRWKQAWGGSHFCIARAVRFADTVSALGKVVDGGTLRGLGRR